MILLQNLRAFFTSNSVLVRNCAEEIDKHTSQVAVLKSSLQLEQQHAKDVQEELQKVKSKLSEWHSKQRGNYKFQDQVSIDFGPNIISIERTWNEDYGWYQTSLGYIDATGVLHDYVFFVSEKKHAELILEFNAVKTKRLEKR